MKNTESCFAVVLCMGFIFPMLAFLNIGAKSGRKTEVSIKKGKTMNDREKLIELISEAKKKDWDICNDCAICEDCAYEDIKNCHDSIVADHLIANGVTFQQWIPVTERLPKNDYEKPWWERQQYLVCLQNGGMRVAVYGYKECDWWIDKHNCVLDERFCTGVTHWMQLPQPPKGE